MEIAIIVFGLVLMLAAFAYCGWRVWRLGQRGWKDHLWVWEDANRAARLILIILGVQIVMKWVWRGWSDEVLFYMIFAAIFVPIPHIAYTIGRLIGIRHRARRGIRLS